MKIPNIIFYSIVILFVLIYFPLLKPGYMFAIDHVLNPNGWFPKLGEHIYWVGILSQIFITFHIPIWVLEKCIIIITFILPSLGGYLLVKNTKNNYAIIFCLLLCIINPFIYSRFIDGQANAYLSYAFYPLFFYFLNGYFFENRKYFGIYIGIVSLLLCLTSLHNTIMIAFLIILLGIIGIVKERNTVLIFLKKYIKLLGILIFLNAFWLLPYIFSPQDARFALANEIKNFDKTHLEAFQNRDSSINIYTENLALKGYWGDYQKRFVPSDLIEKDKKNSVIYFIWVLVGIGIFSVFLRGIQTFEIYLLLVALVSYILSLGIGNQNIFSSINQFLFDHLPFYSGFREPQKWIMLLVVIYAYFGAYGIIYLETILKNYLLPLGKKLILGLLCFIPLFYTYNMLFGFSGQVSIQSYPKEWQEVKDEISKKSKEENHDCSLKREEKIDNCYSILGLPWHGYMSINWTQRKVGGWIFRYFGDDILFGDNIEIADVYSSSTRRENTTLDGYFSPNGVFRKETQVTPQSLESFYSDLKSLGIENIILLQESDYKNYERIVENEYTELIQENTYIKLYKIKSIK